LEFLGGLNATRKTARPKPNIIYAYFPFSQVIIGAETGNRKEKVIPKKEWIDSLCKQADEFGIKVFMKDSLIPIVGEKNMRRELIWRTK